MVIVTPSLLIIMTTVNGTKTDRDYRMSQVISLSLKGRRALDVSSACYLVYNI